MCEGTKGENNICIFHCNPYNIWVGRVARQGFGELFSCLGLNDKLFLQEQTLLVLLHGAVADTPGAVCGWKALYNQNLCPSGGFMDHLNNSVNLTVLLISFRWFHWEFCMQEKRGLSSPLRFWSLENGKRKGAGLYQSPGILSFLPILHTLWKADTATVRSLGVSQQTSPGNWLKYLSFSYSFNSFPPSLMFTLILLWMLILWARLVMTNILCEGDSKKRHGTVSSFCHPLFIVK